MNEELLKVSFTELLPQEERIEVQRKKQKLQIGVPKETFMQEKRIGLSPEGVHLLTSNGHEVVIESGAGLGARYTDKDYSDAGAQIAYSTKEVFEKQIILKIEPPSDEELEMMKMGQTLISALQVKTRSQAYFKSLMSKKATAIAVENITDDEGMLPIMRCMSEIAGSASVQLGAELLTGENGKGYLFGGITGVPQTEVVIIGAGTVGTYAAKSAIALGANVKVFDTSLSRLKRMQQYLKSPVYTCVLQPKLLEKALRRCDVAIGAIRSTSGRTPCVVTEEMVQKMKAKSVVIDISIDHGGCFETSEITSLSNPTFEKYNVIHYCVPNIASRFARTASFALSNIFAPLLLTISDEGGIEETLRYHPEIRTGLYMHKGVLASPALGEWFDLPYSHPDLFFGNIH
ncbi:MAG: alanine dehydrogenase [Schleiferiaceae bacterium]|nr:alanine dehydrogenase [Schleiferiaceae bacterium]